MKKGIVTATIIFCMFFASVIPASAWYLEMDNSDGDNEVDLWFMVEDGETVQLLAYYLGFLFDETELAYSDYTNNIPDGWIEMDTPALTAPGQMQGFFAGQPDYSTALIVTEDLLMVSVDMEVLPGAVQDGSNDIYFPSSSSEADYIIQISILNDQGAIISHDIGTLCYYDQLINGAGLDFASPVPIPGAVWLLGSGFIGLAGIRRRMR
jgi:hypothetical protein